MSETKRKTAEKYDELVQTVKPKGARYLHEKYHHWMDHSASGLRRKIKVEIETEAERLLIVRAISDMFTEFHTVERTGYAFIALHPGIEYSTVKGGNRNRGIEASRKGDPQNGEKTEANSDVEMIRNAELDEGMDPENDTEGRSRNGDSCDILLRGNDGSSLFLMLLINQGFSPRTIMNRITSRRNFIDDHIEEFREDYGIKDSYRLGILLTGSERASIRKGLQMLGTSEGSLMDSEVLVMEFSLMDGTLKGLPSITSSPDGIIERENGFQFRSPAIDLLTHEYLLFEFAAVQGGYADHLMADKPRSKEFTTKELLPILYRDLGLAGKDRHLSPKIVDKRKAYARKLLAASIRMTLRYHVIESSNDEEDKKNGDSGESDTKRPKEPYRLICQGTDLTIVRNNLRKKYVDSCAADRASPSAKRKAVEAYRRRFPRIDRSF